MKPKLPELALKVVFCKDFDTLAERVYEPLMEYVAWMSQTYGYPATEDIAEYCWDICNIFKVKDWYVSSNPELYQIYLSKLRDEANKNN